MNSVVFLRSNGMEFKGDPRLSISGRMVGRTYAYTTNVEVDGVKYTVGAGYENTGGNIGGAHLHDWDEIVYWYREFSTKTAPHMFINIDASMDILELPEPIHAIALYLETYIRASGADVVSGPHKGFIRVP